MTVLLTSHGYCTTLSRYHATLLCITPSVWSKLYQALEKTVLFSQDHLILALQAGNRDCCHALCIGKHVQLCHLISWDTLILLHHVLKCLATGIIMIIIRLAGDVDLLRNSPEFVPYRVINFACNSELNQPREQPHTPQRMSELLSPRLHSSLESYTTTQRPNFSPPVAMLTEELHADNGCILQQL